MQEHEGSSANEVNSVGEMSDNEDGTEETDAYELYMHQRHVDELNTTAEGHWTGTPFEHPISRTNPEEFINQNLYEKVEDQLKFKEDVRLGFFHEMTRSTEYGERLYSNTVTSVPKLGALAASWNASDTCVTTGYKACFQFLFGPQCPYEPYMIIHARHAERWVVECTINGETRHIYSPFEFRVAYINEKLPVKDRHRRSVYLIFLEPSNDRRPYATHMTGLSYLRWCKDQSKQSRRVGKCWTLEDCENDTTPCDLFTLLNNLHEKLLQDAINRQVAPWRIPATEITQYWFADWLLSEEILFKIPPFCNQDFRKLGAPHVVMPDFPWEGWKEYYLANTPIDPPDNLPLPHRARQRQYHQRPWTNDANMKANSIRRFPTPEENLMLKEASVLFRLAENAYRRFGNREVQHGLLPDRGPEWTGIVDPWVGTYAIINGINNLQMTE